MKFSRNATFFIGFLSVGLLAVATAVPAVKRQGDLLSTVLNLVLGLLNTVLSLLGGLGGLTTASSLTPLVGQVTSVLDTATSSLSLVSAAGGSATKRDSGDENVQTVVEVVTSIATTFEPLVNNPNLPTLISAIIPADTSLKNFLDQANTASGDAILPLVAQGLTSQVVSTLEDLQFNQTLGDLGL